jgi:hypothetical protein
MLQWIILITDPPGATSKPEITDYDKDYVKIQWNPPKDNGGAPIQRYIIEKKPKFGNWEQV